MLPQQLCEVFVPVVGSVGHVGNLFVGQPGCMHSTLLSPFIFSSSLSAEFLCNASPKISWHVIRCL